MYFLFSLKMKENSSKRKNNKNYDIYETFDIEENEIKHQKNYLFSKNKNNFIIKLLIISIILSISLIICIFSINYLNKKSISNYNYNMESNFVFLNNQEKSNCPIGYKLNDGKCIINYSFKAIYYTDSNNEKISLFRKVPFDIIEMIIDGEIISPSLEYTFELKGDHIVYVLLNFTDNNSLSNMFSGISQVKSIYFSPLFDTKNITLMRNMFYGCSSLISIDLSNFNTQKVTHIDKMFLGCSSLTNISFSNFDTQNVIYMSQMFSGCSSLKSLDLSNFQTPNLTNMGYMFSDCSSLESINLKNFNTEKVTDMEGLFFSCSSLKNIDISNFNTKNCRNLGGMFFKCSSLQEINLSNFETKNATNMENMFNGCSSLTSINVSNFDTQNVRLMKKMFSGCSSLTYMNLSNFNIQNVKEMNEMFYGCSNLKYIDISSFKNKYVSKVPMFDDIDTVGVIILNKSFMDKIIEQIPNKWKIIIND